MEGKSLVPRRRGFVLLEAVVALAILSVASIAALAAVDRDLDAAVRIRGALVSTALVEDRLQAVRLLDAAGFATPPDSLLRGRFAAPFDAYAWHTKIKPADGLMGLYEVRIDVTWAGGERSLKTRIYRSGRSGRP